MGKLDKRERTAVIIKINDVVERHCKGCEYNKHDKNGALKDPAFCRSQCATGALLQRLGEYLERGECLMSKITKEVYEALKKEGKTDAFIASYFGITQATLSYHKKKWESAADKTTETYDELMQQLKQQLSEKDGLIHTLEKRIEELEAEMKTLNENRLAEAESLIIRLNSEKEHADRTIVELKNEILHAGRELEQYKRSLEEAERENEKLIRQNEKLRKLLEVAIEM